MVISEARMQIIRLINQNNFCLHEFVLMLSRKEQLCLATLLLIPTDVNETYAKEFYQEIMTSSLNNPSANPNLEEIIEQIAQKELKDTLFYNYYRLMNLNLDIDVNQQKNTTNIYKGNFPYKNKIKLTNEQKAIIDTAQGLRECEVIIGNAYAGTGKTTLCSYITERNSSFLYLAFNKNMAEDAKKRIGSNTTDVRTTDSLAYSCVNPSSIWGDERCDFTKMKVNYSLLADALNLLNRFKGLPKHRLARLIENIVANYCNSADEQISSLHIPVTGIEGDKDSYLIEKAQLLWNMMLDSSNKWLPVMPSQVMKYWDLKSGEIPENYEYVIFDEAQDANGAFMSILRRSSCRKILIGDPHQQLYQWRGAVNAMNKINGVLYPMTQSWRFNYEIANYANVILGKKENRPNNKLLGNKAIDSRITTYNVNKPPNYTGAILARTNVQVFYKAVEISKKGHFIHIVNKMSDLEFLLLDALRLFKGEDRINAHHLIANFPDWYSLVSAQELTHDIELKNIIKIIEKKHEVLEEELRILKKHHTDIEGKASVILSTTHKIKGREWETVTLLDDFINIENIDDFDQEARDNELNILYVAATRAIKNLNIPESLDFLTN